MCRFSLTSAFKILNFCYHRCYLSPSGVFILVEHLNKIELLFLKQLLAMLGQVRAVLGRKAIAYVHGISSLTLN